MFEDWEKTAAYNKSEHFSKLMHLLLLWRMFFLRAVYPRRVSIKHGGNPGVNPEGRWILELFASLLPTNKIPRVLVDRRTSVAAPTKCPVDLAALRLSAEGVFPSCVNRFYAECNRESREGNCAPHCLFQKPLAPDDTLRFYPISRPFVFFCEEKMQFIRFFAKNITSLTDLIAAIE